MNETTGVESSAGTGESALQPGRMNALSRYMNVLLSPGPVFEDVRRDPRSWWVPIVVGALLTMVFASLYVSRYDMGLVMHEQLKDSAAMKMIAGLQSPEARDKALDAAVKKIAATPKWQHLLSQWANAVTGWTLMVWFFTFFYGLIALMMGWLGETRASKLWINFGIVVGIGVGAVLISIALQVSQAFAAKSAGLDPQTAPAPAWMVMVGLAVVVAADALIFWSLARFAREIPFGRIMGAVAYGSAPLAIAALVGLVIVLIRTPDVTPMEELVPSNLTALLGLKGAGAAQAALASLGSSLGLFSLWSAVLTIIGLSKVLGRRMGVAAAVVLVPWICWVLLKAGFAAIFA